MQTLHSSIGDVAEWPAFLHGVASLAAGSLATTSVAALVHRDVRDDTEWLARLEHRFSTVVDVQSLETGQSAEVEGRVRVVRRSRPPRGGSGGATGPGAALKVSESCRLGVTEQFYTLAEGGVRFVHR